MEKDALLSALRRLRVEIDGAACFGCGHEHDCAERGCAILREAERRLLRQASTIRRLQEERARRGGET